ncbi:MAG TPA: amino acid ABC transporter substrate-binding protein [Chitinophagaceae bacterium]|jgi:hypothetical protein
MKRRLVFCVGLVALLMQAGFAQERHKIAIFTPLYIDSAFDDENNYRYGAQFPRYINTGLEFYEGAQLALDSLSRQNAQVDAFVYDSRSKASLAGQLDSAVSQGAELIIAFANPEESWNISNMARSKKIPYVNVNLPNDAGITSNPYFVMMSASLQTHINGIYRYLQKYYPLDGIVYFRPAGKMEDVIHGYFEEAAHGPGAVPLKISYVTLPDSFSARDIQSKLDSDHHYVCIAGSLDENFGRKLCQQLSTLDQSYPLTVIGMPTFESLQRDFTLPQYKGLEIVYTTTFYTSRSDKVSAAINDYFNAALYARPGDMALRAYEATWKFTNMLLRYGKDLPSNLGKKDFNLFHDTDIQPVIDKKTNTLEYYENKRLFFVKWLDGIIKGVN